MFMFFLPVSFQLKAPFTYPLLFPTAQSIDLLFLFREFLPSLSLLELAHPHIQRAVLPWRKQISKWHSSFLQVSWKRLIILKYFWELEEYCVLKGFTFSYMENTAGARAEDSFRWQDWCSWWKRVRYWRIMVKEVAGMRQYGRESQGVSTCTGRNGEAKTDNWIVGQFERQGGFWCLKDRNVSLPRTRFQNSVSKFSCHLSWRKHQYYLKSTIPTPFWNKLSLEENPAFTSSFCCIQHSTRSLSPV